MPRTTLHTRCAPMPPVVSDGAGDVLRAIEEHARARPHAVAVAGVGEGGHPVSALRFGELAERAAGLSNEIAGAAGPGSVVVLIGPSGPDLAVWLVAALMAGVLVLPVSPQSTPCEIDDLARRAGAEAVVCERIGVQAERFAKWIDWDLADGPRRSGRIPPLADRRPGSIVLHSSGTLGVSKLAVRDIDALNADAVNVAHATRLTSSDCVLLTMPLSHSYGVDLLLASLLVGASLHTTRSFDPGAIASHLATHATVFPGVPFVLDAIARLGHEGRSSRLRLVFSAGAPLPDSVRDEFEAAWAVRVGDLYGASELGTVTFNDPDSKDYRRGCVGPGLEGVSIRILDPDDVEREMPVGMEGHVAIAAPSMLSRYLDGEVPLATGRLLTGDLGRVDEDGRLFITGRLKLLIDAGGIKVNPIEIETVLRSHPGVADCVVLPLRISGTIARLRAVFVAREARVPPTDTELREFLSSRLSASRIPRVFERVSALPRTSTGKIFRSALMEGRA